MQLNFRSFSTGDSRFSPFRDPREDVRNHREELRHAREDVLNHREERRNAREDVRDGTEEWRNAREDILNDSEERRNAKEDGRSAIPERPKRPKTAFGPPKMAVFEGKGEKRGKRRLAAPKSDEGGGFGGEEGVPGNTLTK